MYHAALSAVRGDLVVEQALRAGVGRPRAPVEVLAAGKAAVAMLRPLSQLGDRLIRVLAVSKEAEGRPRHVAS